MAQAAPASAPASAAAAAVASAQPAATAASASAFSWPDSTRISYLLTGNYRGEVRGDAQVEWVRVGERYQVHLDVTVGPGFAPLLYRRMTSEGRLGPDGLVPERFDQESKVAFRARTRQTIQLGADAVQLPDGSRHDRPAGLQDTASQFVQLTYLFTLRPQLLAAGSAIDIPLALPRSVDLWTYDVVEGTRLDTPIGSIDAFHLKPRRKERPGSPLTVEVWFAPSLRYLPVRIRIEQEPGTFLDLMLERRPQLAAP